MIDWPETARFGYDMDASARTVVNAHGVEVLRRTVDMAEALDRPDPGAAVNPRPRSHSSAR